MGARVMLADPDALNQEGLASRLAGLGIQPEAMAHEPAAVLRLVMEAQHEWMNRKGQGGHADTRHYILVVDELPEVLKTLNGRDTDRVRSALELIGGLSGCKHGVVTVMLAQSWTHAGDWVHGHAQPGPGQHCVPYAPGGGRAHDRIAAWLLEAVGPDPLDLEPDEFYAVGIDSGAVRVRVPPSRAGASARSSASSPESVAAALQRAHDEVLTIIRRQLPAEEETR
jgi:hypothetical protein